MDVLVSVLLCFIKVSVYFKIYIYISVCVGVYYTSLINGNIRKLLENPDKAEFS